jgi:hypothetical protein
MIINNYKINDNQKTDLQNKTYIDTEIWTREDLLLSMWLNACPEIVFKIYGEKIPEKPTIDELQSALYYPKIDMNAKNYLKGRMIKTNFDKWPLIDFENYNKIYGSNSFQKILQEKLKETSQEPKQVIMKPPKIEDISVLFDNICKTNQTKKENNFSWIFIAILITGIGLKYLI